MRRSIALVVVALVASVSLAACGDAQDADQAQVDPATSTTDTLQPGPIEGRRSAALYVDVNSVWVAGGVVGVPTDWREQNRITRFDSDGKAILEAELPIPAGRSFPHGDFVVVGESLLLIGPTCVFVGVEEVPSCREPESVIFSVDDQGRVDSAPLRLPSELTTDPEYDLDVVGAVNDEAVLLDVQSNYRVGVGLPEHDSRLFLWNVTDGTGRSWPDPEPVNAVCTSNGTVYGLTAKVEAGRSISSLTLSSSSEGSAEWAVVARVALDPPPLGTDFGLVCHEGAVSAIGPDIDEKGEDDTIVVPILASGTAVDGRSHHLGGVQTALAPWAGHGVIVTAVTRDGTALVRRVVDGEIKDDGSFTPNPSTPRPWVASLGGSLVDVSPALIAGPGESVSFIPVGDADA